MSQESSEEGNNREIKRCLGALGDCLEMIARALRAKEQRDELRREESQLRDEQYPGDDYGMMLYDEDFKFDWH